MKKRENGIRGFLHTRTLGGVVGIGVILYCMMGLVGWPDLKQFRAMYVADGITFFLFFAMAALIMYIGRIEKDFFSAWRLAFSQKQGGSRMELQKAVNAVGYVEKAIILSEIAVIMFECIDFFYHLEHTIIAGPAIAYMCTGILCMAVFLLILFPVKIRLERRIVSYMEEPADSEKEREEAEGQRLYFSLRAAGLTDRETEVARLAGTGMRNEEIGRELYISTATVKKHMTHILEKMQCKDREGLAERIRGL